MGDDVRDEQRTEKELPTGTVGFEGGGDLDLAFPKRIEIELFDLCDAEGQTRLRVFLAIGGNGGFGWLGSV